MGLLSCHGDGCVDFGPFEDSDFPFKGSDMYTRELPAALLQLLEVT